MWSIDERMLLCPLHFQKLLSLRPSAIDTKMQTVIAADGAMTYYFLVTKVSFYFFKFSAIENLGKQKLWIIISLGGRGRCAFFSHLPAFKFTAIQTYMSHYKGGEERFIYYTTIRYIRIYSWHSEIVQWTWRKIQRPERNLKRLQLSAKSLSEGLVAVKLLLLWRYTPAISTLIRGRSSMSQRFSCLWNTLFLWYTPSHNFSFIAFSSYAKIRIIMYECLNNLWNIL